MQMFRRVACFGLLSGLVSGMLWGSAATAGADNRIVFAGCVADRSDTTVTLDTSARERITIDTTWLKPGFRDALTSDCMTVTTVVVEGKYMAESVEEGDETS